MQKWNGGSCDKVPVRLRSGTRVATAPESWQFCLVFVDLFTEGGLDSGSSDTWYRCRREQEDDIVRQGPRLGFVVETGSSVTMNALSTIFLLFCLAPYFSCVPTWYVPVVIFCASGCASLKRIYNSMKCTITMNTNVFLIECFLCIFRSFHRTVTALFMLIALLRSTM